MNIYRNKKESTGTAFFTNTDNSSSLFTGGESPVTGVVKALLIVFMIFGISGVASAQKKVNDRTTPLHLLKPDYPVPYGPVTEQNITKVLDRIYDYLNKVTPTGIIDGKTGKKITNFSTPDKNAILAKGDFRLISYEWGVTYDGMLAAGKATGDPRFTKYTADRLEFIANSVPYFRRFAKAFPKKENPLRSVLAPRALDDAGAMCFAMIKATRQGVDENLRPLINNYIDYISNKQFRLDDGTLARNRPQPRTLWLDDLFMSVPALAQMGKLTGNKKYYDDAVKQILQFSRRMFDNDEDLYMHGWVEGMNVHPEFFWARANGWALMATVELLAVLPQDYPGRKAILELLRKHIKGIASRQSGKGLWHQLLDRNDSFLETSSTAIFTYSIAKAINEGWIDPKAYGPVAVLGWNALTTKVNTKGQVEGTCVGTGMAFDPAFYYYRPVNVYAAHGYGPVLLAGSEMIKLIHNYDIRINDSAVQFYPKNSSK